MPTVAETLVRRRGTAREEVLAVEPALNLESSSALKLNVADRLLVSAGGPDETAAVGEPVSTVQV